jgi:hypothetical protein
MTTPKQDDAAVPITSFSTSQIRLEVALHRCGGQWYIVFPRAYGMANGSRFFGCLNDPQPGDASTRMICVKSSINDRFWLRNGTDWDQEWRNTMIQVEDLLAVDPPLFKKCGVTRSVETAIGGMQMMVEEVLVEVLVQEAQLCQRCKFCGSWEVNYEGTARYLRIEGKETVDSSFWCQVM